MITHKLYSDQLFYAHDYYRALSFLIDVYRENPNFGHFHWARWEWMIGHSHMSEPRSHDIGVWYDGERVVALATHDISPGEAFILFRKGYETLYPALLDFAERVLSANGSLTVTVGAQDETALPELTARCYTVDPEWNKEDMSVLNCEGKRFDYSLPEGFSIVSFAEELDIAKYVQVLWRGFDHGDTPPPVNPADYRGFPHCNPEHMLFVKAPNGEYTAHCGIWFVKGYSDTALVEPVCTVPAFRRQGHGRAVVLEAVNRCAALGAKQAAVGSDKQFYQSIGFEATSQYPRMRKNL